MFHPHKRHTRKALCDLVEISVSQWGRLKERGEIPRAIRDREDEQRRDSEGRKWGLYLDKDVWALAVAKQLVGPNGRLPNGLSWASANQIIEGLIEAPLDFEKRLAQSAKGGPAIWIGHVGTPQKDSSGLFNGFSVCGTLGEVLQQMSWQQNAGHPSQTACFLVNATEVYLKIMDRAAELGIPFAEISEDERLEIFKSELAERNPALYAQLTERSGGDAE